MKRVVVCPYCRRTSPEPDHLGLTHSCPCGAAFSLVPGDEVAQGVFRLVSGLLHETKSSMAEILECCQVTVYEHELKGPVASGSLSEFVSQVNFHSQSRPNFNLIWVARQDSAGGVKFFGPNQS